MLHNDNYIMYILQTKPDFLLVKKVTIQCCRIAAGGRMSLVPRCVFGGVIDHTQEVNAIT